MYLRVCFIARFGTALHFFYFIRLKAVIDSFSSGKKIATRIASVFLNRKDFVRMFHAHRYIRSVFTYVNTSFYDLACRHSENCVENKSIAMSCGEYVLRTNEIFSCGKYHTNALLRSLRNSP